MKENLENKADDPIIKGKTMISCDHIDCVVYGEFYWCYKNQEKDCGVYKRWKRENP